MFIRTVKTKIKGTEYATQRLVESYRNEEGNPRQRVIMNLGKLDVPKSRWNELAFLLEQRILGQQTLDVFSPELETLADDLYARNEFVRQKPQLEENVQRQKDLCKVDLNSIELQESRSLGPELAVQSVWDDLQLTDILGNAGLSQRQISVAQALVFGKLIEPSSELATWRWFNHKTALAEMTPVDIIGLGKDIFYEVGDILYNRKDFIEQALMEWETNLFSLDRRLFLFDLTNTYFEGSAKGNDLGCYSRSKEKRSDCPLVSLALMVDNQGFPIYSRILKGNQSEPETLEQLLDDFASRENVFVSGVKPGLIMDRGIATKSNIELIQSRGYCYTVIERAAVEKQYAAEYAQLKDLLNQQKNTEELSRLGWSKVREDQDVYVRKIDSQEESQVLVFSLCKEVKEDGIDRLKEERMLEDLSRLKKSVHKKHILVPSKIGERIGRIRQKYPRVSSGYDIRLLLDDQEKHGVDVVWTKGEKAIQRPILSGCYVIQTDRKNMSASESWQDYVTITRVEAAFRDLKSELGLRPVFHNRAHRTQAHLFLGVLAYHLLIGIETRLKRQGENREWKIIRSLLSTHQRATIVLTSEAGERIRIRLSGTPELRHKEIYKLLGVKDKLKRKKSVINERK